MAMTEDQEVVVRAMRYYLHNLDRRPHPLSRLQAEDKARLPALIAAAFDSFTEGGATGEQTE